MEWTQKQRDAIEITDKNILVSAAAGSGKTTVLVERIKNLVINEGIDIDRFLITTFTKAAAAEMKERLDKAIRDEIKKPDVDKERLRKQLQKLPSSNISTFHSFAIEVIRQYPYLTDLEPSFKIADEIQTEIMKKNAMEEVFSRRYEEDYDEFTAFLKKYNTGKNDKRLRENIIDTYRTLVSIPNYIDWAHEKVSLLYDEEPLKKLGVYEMIINQTIKAFDEATECYYNAAILLDDGFRPSLHEKAVEDAEFIEAKAEYLRKAADDCDKNASHRALINEIRGNAFDYKLNQMRAKKDEKLDDELKKELKQKRDSGKKLIDDIKKTYYARSIDEIEQDLIDVREDTEYYIDLVSEFIAAFKEEKDKSKVIDFNDVMHYAIAILENDDAAKELRDKFQYIFVDEYQDSNYLQEKIVRRIQREDNLFLVGDVKQCIYKFRLAEPELFKQKAKDFAKEEDINSTLIKLNNNFRSKNYVIDVVNDIFARAMGEEYRGAELNGKAPESTPGIPARIHLAQLDLLSENVENKLSKSETEAAIVAKIIRERIGGEIFDTKTGETRKLNLRDFAVLARGNNTVEDIEHYLNNEGIDAYGEGGGKYYEAVEIQVFVNLLRVTENMRQDIPLISAMKSVVFGFTVEELAKIRIRTPEGSFYSAVMKYSNEIDDPLSQKIESMIETIARWKEISNTVPLEETIKMILFDTGYYDYCSGLPVGKQRTSNLKLIAEKAANFEKMNYGGLYGFLQYIDAMKESGSDDSEARIVSESENVVRVMTVHKSKGLEFPVVILVGVSKELSSKGSGLPITVHKDYGIALRKSNVKEHWHRKTILQQVIADAQARESLEEEIRILYVALTRAKDCLEIVGSQNSDDVIELVGKPKSYLELIYEPFIERTETEVIRYNNIDELTAVKIAEKKKVETLYDEISRRKNAGLPDEVTDKVKRRLEFEYPYSNERQVKAKYSVSEINAEMKIESAQNNEKSVDEVGRKKPHVRTMSLAKKQRLSAAERGTAMHEVMEKLDFSRVKAEGKGYIESVIKKLHESGRLSDLEAESINTKNIVRFFNTEIGERAAKAFANNKLWREKEFILQIQKDGIDTIVQGIIDCFFVEDDKIILIDYKNSYMRNGRNTDEIIDTYRGQINLYSEALKEAMDKEVSEKYLYLFDTGEFVTV